MASVDLNLKEFQPPKNPINLKKLKRRAVSENGDGMEVEEHNGIQGKPIHSKPRRKRSKKAAEPNESKENLRKIVVPAHRLT